MTPEPCPPQTRLDAIDRALLTMIVFLVIVVLAVSKLEPNDGQTFQVISGLLTTFSGIFAGRLLPNKGRPTQVLAPPEDQAK